MRGISKDFATEFKKCKLYELYNEHINELIIGVRKNYLNLYYNCDSIAKVTYTNKKIVCEIDRYYFNGEDNSSKDKGKRCRVEPIRIYKDYEIIKRNSDDKRTLEKMAQSKLVILNNNNNDSNWFCIDVEWVKQFANIKEKKEADFNGRFDIIAISKEKPHKVALIELKYGGGAISGASGIYKHVQDFIKFSDKGFFEKYLKKEIIQVIKSQINLGISVPFVQPDRNDLLTPDFYFITLDNNAKTEKSTPRQTMAGYLFKDRIWDCKRLSSKYCVETDFGNITKKNNRFNATFLFSKAKIENIDITDIIDSPNYDRIIPS